MAKNVIINGVIYSNVPHVDIPLSTGDGSAKFVDTDSGDALAGDIRANKKAWVGGNEVTGTIPVKSGTDVIISGRTVTHPSGIYDDQIISSIDEGNIGPTADATSPVLSDETSFYPIVIQPKATVNTPGYILAISNGPTITKYIQTETQTITPTTASQTINPTSGKLLSSVSVDAVDVSATASESDVLNGKTFFAGSLTLKTGTATVPTVGQDPITKVLTIL